MAGINLRRSLFGGNDIAIDLGTANTLIYVKGVGVMVDEPTLIAVNKEDGSILTVGEEAKNLVGRVPDSIKLIKPLRDGVISEIEMAEELVKTLLTRAIGRSYSRPRIVMCVPNGVTSVEQRSIETAAHATGASEVYTVEEPMAAAIGAGLQIYEPFGNMVIDIGGGTTEIAVISMGDIVNANSVRVGGEDMTDRLIEWLRTEHSMLVDGGNCRISKACNRICLSIRQRATSYSNGSRYCKRCPKTSSIRGLRCQKCTESSSSRYY